MVVALQLAVDVLRLGWVSVRCQNARKSRARMGRLEVFKAAQASCRQQWSACWNVGCFDCASSGLGSKS